MMRRTSRTKHNSPRRARAKQLKYTPLLFSATVILCMSGFLFGRYVIKMPTSKTYAASSVVLNKTTLSGTIQLTDNAYYLITSDHIAYKLEITPAIDAKSYMGKHVTAAGVYVKPEKSLIVIEPNDFKLSQ